MNRRGFMSGLSILTCLPSLLPSKVFMKQDYRLPTDCDLSFTSLQYAINIGEEKKLGRARKLFVGSELIFVSRELLGTPGLPYSTDPEINALRNDMLVYEVVDSLPHGNWVLQFDKGTVGSGLDEYSPA